MVQSNKSLVDGRFYEPGLISSLIMPYLLVNDRNSSMLGWVPIRNKQGIAYRLLMALIRGIMNCFSSAHLLLIIIISFAPSTANLLWLSKVAIVTRALCIPSG